MSHKASFTRTNRSVCLQGDQRVCSVRRLHAGRLICRAGGNGADARLDASDKQKEIAKMLLTTQKNMLALNNSRVKVQEELAVANRRIADLEREVERLRAEQAAAQQAIKEAQLPPPFSSARGVSVASPPSPEPPAVQQQQQQYQQPPQQQYQQQPPPQQYQVQQQAQQQQAAPAPAPPMQQPPSPAPPAVITLTYVSGWHNAFIHYTVDGKSWTNVPGVRMQHTQGDHNSKTITIEGNKMEFVMNNGENDWDTPDRYSDKPKNYEIHGPGNYRLKSGKLEKLRN